MRHEAKVPWRIYRPGRGGRPLADRRDRQGRRAVLLLQGHPADAHAHAVVGPRHRRRGRRDQPRPGRLRGQGDGLPRPPARPRRPDVPPHRPRAAHRRRAVQGADQGGEGAAAHAQRRRPRARRAAGPARRRRSRKLPGAKQVTDLVLAELGIPRESFAYLTYPTHFDSTKTQAALAGSGIEVPPFATYAPDALGVLGAQLQPVPAQGQAARPRHQGQDGDDHRRVVGHRPGHRAAGRCGRRQGHPGRPRRRGARADPKPRSRTSAASRSSTAATSPT